MADINVDTQTDPSTPSSGSSIIYINSTNKELHTRDDAGIVRTIRPVTNASIVTTLTAPAVNTFLTGSSITIPTQLLKVGTMFMWRFGITKTNSGTTAPIWTVTFGTAGTVADTARLTFTGNAQTAVADTGWSEIWATVLTTGVSGTIEGVYSLTHTLATTGLGATGSDARVNTSGAFDTTVATSIIGIAVNPGTTATWTFTHISVVAFNL